MIGMNFAAENMTISQDLCEKSALNHGCSDFITYNPVDIDEEFFLMNAEIFNQPRGYGYWLWKPYFLYQTMNHTPENEIIVYLDSGVEVVNSLDYIKDRMKDNIDIWLFGNEHRHVEWCKDEVLYKMLSHPAIEFSAYNNRQVQASVIFVRNTQYARNFVKEWLLWCQMPNFIDDSPSQYKNVATFKEHRHDQAILTNVAINHFLPLHWWPTQYGHSIKHNYPNDDYPQLFNHHRKRNDEW
jgi:hypothetical protein